jgi:hypothetical protein
MVHQTTDTETKMNRVGSMFCRIFFESLCAQVCSNYAHCVVITPINCALSLAREIERPATLPVATRYTTGSNSGSKYAKTQSITGLCDSGSRSVQPAVSWVARDR